MGPGGNGNGNGFDGFDDFIRDREQEFSSWDDPADPWGDYARQAGSQSRGGHGGHGHGARGRSSRPGVDRTIVESISRIIDGLAGLAGEALPSDLQQRLEQALRELLVALRDILDMLIDRIDGRRGPQPQVEEIPID